jgi:hypothetical protein
MDSLQLPLLAFERVKDVMEPRIVYDRDSSLLVLTLSNENDYSGEFVNIGRVCIALGAKMNAVDVQVQYSSSEAKIVFDLTLPECYAARVTFTDSQLQTGAEDFQGEDDCRIEVRPDMSVMHLYFIDFPEKELLRLSPAKNVVFDVTPDNRLAGIWISGIEQR